MRCKSLAILNDQHSDLKCANCPARWLQLKHRDLFHLYLERPQLRDALNDWLNFLHAWEGRFQAWEGLGRTDGWTDGWTKVPCVLQDFLPFETAALPLLPIYNQQGEQGNGYRSPHIPLGRPVTFLNYNGVWCITATHITLTPHVTAS